MKKYMQQKKIISCLFIILLVLQAEGKNEIHSGHMGDPIF